MTRVRVKPVWHETDVRILGRPLCVAESPVFLLLRLKGTRQTLRLPWAMAHVRAAMMEADQDRVARRPRITRGALS